MIDFVGKVQVATEFDSLGAPVVESVVERCEVGVGCELDDGGCARGTAVGRGYVDGECAFVLDVALDDEVVGARGGAVESRDGAGGEECGFRNAFGDCGGVCGARRTRGVGCCVDGEE